MTRASLGVHEHLVTLVESYLKETFPFQEIAKHVTYGFGREILGECDLLRITPYGYNPNINYYEIKCNGNRSERARDQLIRYGTYLNMDPETATGFSYTGWFVYPHRNSLVLNPIVFFNSEHKERVTIEDVL